MVHRGSCHCGKIAYEVTGVIEQVMECNCSHCSRKGYLLWFVERDQLVVTTPDQSLRTYTFNKHVIHHHFCSECGCAPFGLGTGPSGKPMAAINVRCLENVERSGLTIIPVDGKRF